MFNAFWGLLSVGVLLVVLVFGFALMGSWKK